MSEGVRVTDEGAGFTEVPQGVELSTTVRSDVEEQTLGAEAAIAPAATTDPYPPLILGLIVVVLALLSANLAVSVGMQADIDDIEQHVESSITLVTAFETTGSNMFTDNYCADTNPGLDNFNCTIAVANQVEQAGANVTEGFMGLINNNATPPITTPYYQAGLCPVNVHWHLGAEHLSVGEYDEKGDGPYDSYAIDDDHYRRLASGGVRIGYQCHHYDDSDSKFTDEYNWEHCTDMVVGQTYEVHWPHSTVGACGTPYQYQTPFYDGVFCNYAAMAPNGTTTHNNVGVQSQVFTIVNDDDYYYPDLFKGMIVAGDFGSDIAYYTGSTTGTTRDNDICSAYSPITWQVDRKCHLVSASSFDKMCADMKSQVDDMSKDLYAHGARELVTKELSSTQVVTWLETRKK